MNYDWKKFGVLPSNSELTDSEESNECYCDNVSFKKHFCEADTLYLIPDILFQVDN